MNTLLRLRWWLRIDLLLSIFIKFFIIIVLRIKDYGTETELQKDYKLL